jgi:acyl carrier protein
VPDQNEIVGAIEGIIKEEFNPPEITGVFGRDTPLFDDGLGLDSFSVVELISALETRFNFEFSEADFQEEHFRTIGTLSDLIAHYIDQPPSP